MPGGEAPWGKNCASPFLLCRAKTMSMSSGWRVETTPWALREFPLAPCLVSFPCFLLVSLEHPLVSWGDPIVARPPPQTKNTKSLSHTKKEPCLSGQRRKTTAWAGTCSFFISSRSVLIIYLALLEIEAVVRTSVLEIEAATCKGNRRRPPPREIERHPSPRQRLAIKGQKRVPHCREPRPWRT